MEGVARKVRARSKLGQLVRIMIRIAKTWLDACPHTSGPYEAALKIRFIDIGYFLSGSDKQECLESAPNRGILGKSECQPDRV
jgi:hypothetical protein